MPGSGADDGKTPESSTAGEEGLETGVTEFPPAGHDVWPQSNSMMGTAAIVEETCRLARYEPGVIYSTPAVKSRVPRR